MWKSNKYCIFWVCVCSLSYPVCTSIAHATYIVMCPVWLYHISPHYLIKGTTFGKMLLNIKYVFWFSLQSLSETLLILRRIQRDIMIIALHIMYPLFLSDFDEAWIFPTDFQKYSNIKFHENPSNGSRVVPCGRTDGRRGRQTDRTKLIVAFRNFTNAPNKVLIFCYNNYCVECKTTYKERRFSFIANLIAMANEISKLDNRHILWGKTLNKCIYAM